MTLQEANILPGNILTAVLVTLIEIASDTKFRTNRSTHRFLKCLKPKIIILTPQHRKTISLPPFGLLVTQMRILPLKGIHFHTGVETFV